MNTDVVDGKCTIRVKDIVDENFQDYKKTSMFIATIICDFKCCKELGLDLGICQNMDIVKKPNIEISFENVFKKYTSNPITKSIIFGGLEPMLQFDELLQFIKYFRQNGCNDDIVIYTGYYPHECEGQISKLKSLNNIIMKYGRFIPKIDGRFDEILGVFLSSENQYAEKIC